MHFLNINFPNFSKYLFHAGGVITYLLLPTPMQHMGHKDIAAHVMDCCDYSRHLYEHWEYTYLTYLE